LIKIEERSRVFRSEIRWLWSQGDHPPRCCIIALHGLGQDGSRILNKLQPLVEQGATIVAPDGPHRHEVRRPDSIRKGHAWYLFTGDQELFKSSMLEAEADLLHIVDTVQEESGILPNRTILLGFSQGGYLAGFVASRHPDRFAGCVIASARLKHEFIVEELSRGELPEFLFLHDKKDPLTAADPVRNSLQQVEDAGGSAKLQWHDDGHRLGSGSIDHLQRWLKDCRFL